jgi:hypothetical protein
VSLDHFSHPLLLHASAAARTLPGMSSKMKKTHMPISLRMSSIRFSTSFWIGSPLP